jgi:phosphopantothenoylcysteine decarboxylase/phosphopantothenate--cysteine ligase
MSANILLGVTGGIAAYKMLSAASSLTKLGYNVYTVMTESAAEFVSPLAFHSITHLPVETDLFKTTSSEVKHIELADKTDLFLIAPATANFIAKAAAGIADDLLTTVILAVQAPILIAPSMNVHMFENSVVQRNLKTLEDLGYKIITPEAGYLACGYTGKGRLPEAETLVQSAIKELSKKDLSGKKVLVTAGPTREAIDPVRFISNYSSGKMGYALAKAASYRGAEVVLVSGPTNLKTPLGVEKYHVETAEDMKNEVFKHFESSDIIIMAAAVADYRPKKINKEKIKKTNDDLQLDMERTTDILAELGKRKTDDKLLIGFAAESSRILKNAEDKLKRKNADYIIANDISADDSGFAGDKNQITILSRDNQKKFPLKEKEELADEIFDYLLGIECKN